MGTPRVAYLTDVEGMWTRLSTFAHDNPLVKLDPGGHLVLSEEAVFVFGGDAIDRGPESMRLVSVLTEAKLRYPSRVFLLAGNRDLNKLRLWRELQGEPNPHAPRELRRDPVALLRWIFQNTMGAGEAFAMRWRELGPAKPEAEVVESYLRDLEPEGALTRYLALCQLGVRLGSTLFVHGAVTAESLGAVPERDRPLADVDAWVEALNRWYANQIEAFRTRTRELDGTPSWEPVIAYQAPRPGTRFNQASVIYGRLTDDLQNPHLPERGVVETLRTQGVSRLMVGHTPAGDVPSVLRSQGFELVMADNSRGRVATGTQVLIDGETLEVRGTTQLDSGERAELRYRITPSDPGPLGWVEGDSGRLVKGPLADGRIHLWRGLPGYAVEQIAVTAAELQVRRLEPPRFAP